MSQFIIDTADAYDRHGVIRYMVRSGGYVMVRRPRCTPFVMSEKDWRKLPKNQDEGMGFSTSCGVVSRAAKGRA